MTGLKKNRIIQSVRAVTSRNFIPHIVKDYNHINVSEKVLNVILSYTDYVNRTVWQKEF